MRALFLICLFLESAAFGCGSLPVAGKDLLTGKVVSMEAEPSRKGTVVLFLSAKCPCSKSHETGLAELAREFTDFSFVALHSNSDEPLEFAAEHFRAVSLPFPVLRDEKAEIASRFGALKTPHAYVLGPKGECLFDGGVDDSKDPARAKQFFLKNALTEIRAGREPAEKTVRTLGCIIKRA